MPRDDSKERREVRRRTAFSFLDSKAKMPEGLPDGIVGLVAEKAGVERKTAGAWFREWKAARDAAGAPATTEEPSAKGKKLKVGKRRARPTAAPEPEPTPEPAKGNVQPPPAPPAEVQPPRVRRVVVR